MRVPVGTRLGPYEITAPLGAGGMGEVFRARDTKLDREVAIKVLPAEVACDEERLARCGREAHLHCAERPPARGGGVRERRPCLGSARRSAVAPASPPRRGP